MSECICAKLHSSVDVTNGTCASISCLAAGAAQGSACVNEKEGGGIEVVMVRRGESEAMGRMMVMVQDADGGSHQRHGEADALIDPAGLR